jgi:hypothetical protein
MGCFENKKDKDKENLLCYKRTKVARTFRVLSMDQISIKTPNPKCRLYWRLIEFIDWRYSQ